MTSGSDCRTSKPDHHTISNTPDGSWPKWLTPHPENPRPARIQVYFCSVCGLSAGIEDYDRIRHEHFENDRRCRDGVWDIRTYTLEAGDE